MVYTRSVSGRQNSASLRWSQNDVVQQNLERWFPELSSQGRERCDVSRDPNPALGVNFATGHENHVRLILCVSGLRLQSSDKQRVVSL